MGFSFYGCDVVNSVTNEHAQQATHDRRKKYNLMTKISCTF